MPSFPGIAANEVIDWAASYSGPVMIKGTGTAYTFTGTSATGISDPDYPGLTTRGLQYLDGTFYVMEPDGTIRNSTPAADDPTSWPTDGFISAQFEPDSGVFLAKVLNYIVALGQWTTELFWNTGNATGSPLSPVSNGVLLIGCASANSVAQTESTIIWMAQRKAQSSSAHYGRFIAMLVGTGYEELSTPDVCRVLEEDDLSLVRSAIMELGGKTWYALTLGSLGITLVFDLKAKEWYVWTRLAAGTAISVTGLGQSLGIATGTTGGHTLQDGDPAVISGASPAGYNGTFNVSVSTSTTRFSYVVSPSLAGTATGTITLQPYVQRSFDMVACLGFASKQLALDMAGNVYALTLAETVDSGTLPIDLRIRTRNLDSGAVDRKFASSVALVGDVVGGATGLLRASDDDYASWSSFRRFDLGLVRSISYRWGSYRRRAWEFRYTGTAQVRMKSIEVAETKGAT